MVSLYSGPSVRQRTRLQGLYGPKAAAPKRMSDDEWNAQTAEFRAAHPDLAPDGSEALPEDDLSSLYNSDRSGRQDGVPGRDMALATDPSAKDFARDFGKVMAMGSPMMSFARNMITGEDPIQGPAPPAGAANTGMNIVGGVANPELMGRSDPSQDMGAGTGASAADMGTESGDGKGNGFWRGGRLRRGDLGPMPMGAQNPMATMRVRMPTDGRQGGAGFKHGGKVAPEGLYGPDPKGPDDGYAALDVGELVVNAAQQKRLKPESLADLKAVLKKTGAKGVKK